LIGSINIHYTSKITISATDCMLFDRISHLHSQYHKTKHIIQLDVKVLSSSKGTGLKFHIQTETLYFATENINASISPVY